MVWATRLVSRPKPFTEPRVCVCSVTAKQAAALLATSGAHRVAVVDSRSSGHVQGIVTPCGILRVLRDRVADLGEVGSVPVGALFDIFSPVVTTHADTPARSSIKKLLTHGYSGMPVVNDQGAVVAALSFGNLRSIATMLPEHAHTALQRHTSLWLATLGPNGAQDPLAVQRNMTVLPTDTLATAIAMLAYSRAHRMYIVDKDRRPIGIITIRSMYVVRGTGGCWRSFLNRVMN